MEEEKDEEFHMTETGQEKKNVKQSASVFFI